MLDGMPERPNTIPVVDFRRTRLVLEWDSAGGTWTACDTPPALVHGIAFIRPSPPNICIFGQGGALTLQVGAERFAINEEWPRIRCGRAMASFGLRRNFVVESGEGATLFSHSYWSHRGRDFFCWLAERAQDPFWRADAGKQWTDGIEAQAMRPQ